MGKKRYRRLIAVVLAFALLLSMPGTVKGKAKVKLNKTSMTVTIGSTVDLKVKNTTKSVKWSSSNKNIASVNSYGEVTGKRAGSARITAKVGKKKLYCTVTVPNQNLSDKSIFIQVGEKQSLSLYGIASSDTVFWGSDYESIATVSQSGEVTAKSIGTTTVYAVINSGIGKTYSCEVVVYSKNSSGDIITSTPKPTVTPTAAPTATPKPSYIPVTKVTLAQKSMWLYAGNTSRLTADVLPADATNKKLRWNSTDASIASVGSDGTVKGLKAGTTAVYVTTVDGEFMAICTVTVTGSITPSASPSASPSAKPSASPSASPNVVPVNKVSLSRKEIQLNEGESQTLQATISPNNATNKTVTWSSGNEAVAKVDSNGRVSTVSAGSTMVFVTTVDGEYVAVCKVKVVAKNSASATPTPTASATPTPTASATPTPTASPTPTSTASATPTPEASPDVTPVPFGLDKTSLELFEDQSEQLVLKGVTGTASWTSSAEQVAEVSQDGLVTAKKKGSADITVIADGKSAICKVTVDENVEAELQYNSDAATEVVGCSNRDEATKLVIPEGVTKIGKDAFSGAVKLWSVTLPSTLQIIGEGAFKNCSNIESIIIPEGITTIESGAFSGCSSLQSISLPDSVTSIGEGAFSGCSSLKKISLPKKVTILSKRLFADCSKLEEISVSNVTTIEAEVFSGCVALNCVKDTSKITSISDDALKDCSKIKLYVVSGSYLEGWAIKNGVSYEVVVAEGG